MIELTESEKQKLWEEVREEFPDDEMMQEIHYIRLLHYHLTRDLSDQDRIRFFNGQYGKE